MVDIELLHFGWKYMFSSAPIIFLILPFKVIIHSRHVSVEIGSLPFMLKGGEEEFTFIFCWKTNTECYFHVSLSFL